MRQLKNLRLILFGSVPYDLNTFRALYGPSFTVELFDFISDTGILDGLDVGAMWETPVRENIEAHSKTGELVPLCLCRGICWDDRRNLAIL